MDTTTETVAEYVDRLRKRADLTWEQVAEALGVSTQTVRRWKRDNWQPIRLDQAFLLADLIPNLDVSRFNAKAAA